MFQVCGVKTPQVHALRMEKKLFEPKLPGRGDKSSYWEDDFTGQTSTEVIKDGDAIQCAATLNADLTKIYNWGLKWKVVFAPEQWKVMTLSKTKSSQQLDLSLGGVALEEVDELDILVVKFSQLPLTHQLHLRKGWAESQCSSGGPLPEPKRSCSHLQRSCQEYHGIRPSCLDVCQ